MAKRPTRTLVEVENELKRNPMWDDLEHPKSPLAKSFRAKTDAERGITEVVYECNNCAATQTLRFFSSERLLDVVNCASCGAGQQMEPNEMMARKVGMFPKIDETVN